ncbi:MAG: hypothetical protein U1B83_04635 [Candidatus Cloacimonadaceae bacterium]|nr:hypothetical protein [Candidatus Cloacimonadaceae bacterium]
MKVKSDTKKSALNERAMVAAFLIESERKKEQEFRDYIHSQLGPVAAGKRIVLNSK